MPVMHPNFWIACLQLIYWVFLKPITLRRYTAYLVPGLVEDFTIWEAWPHILKNRGLRRLLVQSITVMYVFPPIISIIILLVATIFGWQVNWIAAGVGLIACLGYGLIGETAGVIGVGVGSSIAHSIGTNLFGGILIPIALGLGNIGLTNDVLAVIEMGVLFGISAAAGMIVTFILLRDKVRESIIIVSFSIIGGTAAGIGSYLSSNTSLTIAIVISIVVGLTAIFIIERNVGAKVFISMALGLAVGVLVGAGAGELLSFEKSQFNTLIAVLGGGLIGTGFAMLLRIPKRAEKDMLAGLVAYATAGIGAIIAILQVAGISGALAAGVGYTIMFILFYFHLLYYPFEFLWHILMLYRASQNESQAIKYCQLSPIHWDDHIWLPLPLLDSLLLLTTRDNQEGGLAEITFVAQSFRQQWAAGNALRAFTAEKLSGYKTVTQILKMENEISWLPDDLSVLGKDIAEAMPRFLSISRDVEIATHSDSLYNRRLGLREALERLENLEKSLNLQGGQTYQRWHPAVESWQKILLAELDSSEISQNNEEIVIVNPYVVGNPIRLNRKGLFKGRYDLRDAVAKALLERGRQTLVLHGPRRMGKTSFLLQLPALLSGKTIPTFMDLQRPAYLTDDASFLLSVARSISRDARPYRLIIPAPSQLDFQAAPFFAFDEWLEEKALPALGDFNLLLTLDEFEKLGEAVSDGQISHKLLDEIRHTIQHQEKISLLFAGVQTLEQLGPGWASYFINVQPLAISYLNPSEAEDLIRNPDSEIPFNLNYTDNAIAQILYETHCHPYLLQLVCFSIVELANARHITKVDGDLVEAAVVTALKQGRPYFQNVWDEAVGLSGQKLLSDIAQSVEEVCLTPTNKEDQDIITKLVQCSILTETNGRYAIEVPLIRRWIAEHAPTL
ncbi:MAG: hypothetical protein DPW11_02615 [bacterium]|nr:hypothetical protein [Anaerolineales bacterium]MCQ3944644.1 hypothetical protein [bacterium]